MSVRWIANSLKHHHSLLLLVMIKVLREVPRSREHFFLNYSSNKLLLNSRFLRAELVCRVRDLVSIGDFFDSKTLKHPFTELCRLILADLLWGNELSELLIFVLLLE